MSGTEAELVFWGMTKAELLEALDYLRDQLTTFQRTHRIGAFATATTDGPRKLLDAMQMAWLRESERRFGVEPWEYGQPIPEDHFFARLLESYEYFAGVNPDQVMKRPPARERAPYRTCQSCFARYQLDEGHWSRLELEGQDIGLAVICKGCEAAQDARREVERRADEAHARDLAFWDAQDAPLSEEEFIAAGVELARR